MAPKWCRVATLGALISAAVLFVDTQAATAAEVTANDLRAISNALGFLEGLPHGAPVTVGIVYAADVPDAKSDAVQTAATLNAIPGPNQSSFRSDILTVRELAQTAIHLDAVLLLPSTMSQAAAIGDIARRKRLVTISTSPSCIEARCCVLMVRAEERVEIVLDTTMADSVDAQFSSVFKMMVERR